jgi:hypothetical protein
MIDNRSQQHKYKDKKSGKLILHENSALVQRGNQNSNRLSHKIEYLASIF